MKAEAMCINTECINKLRWLCALGGDGFQRQHFLPCPGTERNPVDTSRRSQQGQRGIRFNLGQVAHLLLLKNAQIYSRLPREYPTYDLPNKYSFNNNSITSNYS